MSATSNIEIGRCGKCKAPIYQDHPLVWCVKCNEPLSYDVNARRKIGGSLDEGVSSVQPASPIHLEDHPAINALRIFAWLNLIGGIIVAFLLSEWLWAGKATSQQATPLNVALSIVFLAEGVFGCAFLLVVCSIAENLIAIRRNTEATHTKLASMTSLNITQVNKSENS